MIDCIEAMLEQCYFTGSTCHHIIYKDIDLKLPVHELCIIDNVIIHLLCEELSCVQFDVNFFTVIRVEIKFHIDWKKYVHINRK